MMSELTLTFVDDSEADHVLIQDAVEALAFPVRCHHFVHARPFMEALDRGEIAPHAVITDLNMPGPTGFDLIGALRTRPMWAHLPVLILSTSPADVDRERAATLNIAGYFVKPVLYAALVEQLHEMVTLVQRWTPAAPAGRNLLDP